MDSKISEFPVASGLLAADLIPIVSGGVNKTISAGVFSLNLTNFGNKGITKNIVTPVSTSVIPLTGTLYTLTVPFTEYTLGAGSDGQEITLVSLVSNVSVVSSFASFAAASFGNRSSLTLVSISSVWIPKSLYNCTLA